jgi:hypothetical protein
MVRAKFRVVKVTDDGAPGCKSVTLRATTGPENRVFFANAPAGLIELAVVAPDAAALFAESAEVFVDFTPVPAVTERFPAADFGELKEGPPLALPPEYGTLKDSPQSEIGVCPTCGRQMAHYRLKGYQCSGCG